MSKSSASVLINAVDSIMRNKEMNREALLLSERAGEMRGDWLAAKLAGIYMNPAARNHLDNTLSSYWADQSDRLNSSMDDLNGQEIIIGAGYHAAVYAAARVQMGKPRPVVLEADTVGGAFAVGRGKPVFRLNSRNRPGVPGIPREGQLNHLPGAPVQASMLTSDEYPDNAVMRFVIRATLAAYADVIPGRVVSYADNESMDVVLDSGQVIEPSRIIDARGMGTESTLKLKNPEARPNVFTFFEFMDHMAGNFPLRNMRRMAVVGDKNAAMCAVESLVGIAPRTDLSLPELDWVQEVDCYAPNFESSKEDWRSSQGLSRYIELERYLPRVGVTRQSPSRRVRVLTIQGFPVSTPDGASIGPRSYDMVIVAAGNRLAPLMSSVPDASASDVGWNSFTPVGMGTPVARRYQSREVWAIGPRAGLPYNDAERAAGAANIPDSRAAMWRTGPKTTALAMSLA